jgi:hypothetical protein
MIRSLQPFMSPDYKAFSPLSPIQVAMWHKSQKALVRMLSCDPGVIRHATIYATCEWEHPPTIECNVRLPRHGTTVSIETVREIVEYYAQASDQWTTALNCEWVCHFEGNSIPLNTLLKDTQPAAESFGLASIMHFSIVRS